MVSVALQPAPPLPEKKTVKVLDLCCAPGAKLCHIVDKCIGMKNKDPANMDFSVVGVDLSEERLATCDTQVFKAFYAPTLQSGKAGNIKKPIYSRSEQSVHLVRGDATSQDVLSSVTNLERDEETGEEKLPTNNICGTKSARKKYRESLAKQGAHRGSGGGSNMTGTVSIDENEVAELAEIQRNTRLNTPQGGTDTQSIAPQNQNLLGRILNLSFLGNPTLDPFEQANKKFSETYGQLNNPVEPTGELPTFGGNGTALQRDASGGERGRHSSLGA